jgi:hypothetical protein
MLRMIFGSRRDDIIGEWRRLRNVKFYDLYYSANIIWVIKSRRIIWAGNVLRMRERYIQGFGGEICGKETTWKTQV